jgi:ribosomal protein S18 acetylase RimI-like enzyme
MYVYTDQTEKVIGYFSIQLLEHEECELNNLCVLPRARHLGIGSILVNFALEKAKELGCKKMTIGIVEENTALKEWYEKLGFVHTGVKKFDFFPFTCGYMEICL